jgi:hypothetical protein
MSNDPPRQPEEIARYTEAADRKRLTQSAVVPQFEITVLPFPGAANHNRRHAKPNTPVSMPASGPKPGSGKSHMPNRKPPVALASNPKTHIPIVRARVLASLLIATPAHNFAGTLSNSLAHLVNYELEGRRF